MKKILLLVIAFPILAFAVQPEEIRMSGLEMYNFEVRRLDIKRSARSIFVLTAEDSALLTNVFLTDSAGDNGAELAFKRDARLLITEVTAWQKSHGAKSSVDYVEEIFKGHADLKTYDWAVRRENVILAFSERYDVRKAEYQDRLDAKRKAEAAASRHTAIHEYWFRRLTPVW